jgi:hypothetical protein
LLRAHQQRSPDERSANREHEIDERVPRISLRSIRATELYPAMNRRVTPHPPRGLSRPKIISCRPGRRGSLRWRVRVPTFPLNKFP